MLELLLENAAFDDVKAVVDAVYEDFAQMAELLIEDARTLFPGEFYRDHSRLKDYTRGKIAQFFHSIKVKTKQVLGKEKSIPITTPPKRMAIYRATFAPIFVLGYQVHQSRLLYEIWFDPFIGRFVTFDTIAKPVDRGEYKLNDEIKIFIDKISDVEPEADLSKKELALIQMAVQRDYTAQSFEDLVKQRLAHDNERALTQRQLSMVPSIHDAYDPDAPNIDALLEATTAARDLMTTLFKGSLKPYYQTRITSRIVKRFWQVWGKNVVTPMSVMGVKNPKKIETELAKGFFVIGYTFDNKINTEVWYIIDRRSGDPAFYAFDITSSQIIAKKPKLREALNAITDKFSLDFGTAISTKDERLAQKRVEAEQAVLDDLPPRE